MIDLLDWAATHARRTDPATSHAAARAAKGLAHHHRQMILACLSDGRPRAAEEIGDAIGLDHVAVNRRLSDLERDGHVMPTDSLHRNRSGRRAVQYRSR